MSSKILITGCTDTHINDPNRVSDVKFISTPELLATALRRQDHAVQHRALKREPGKLERPEHMFDKVICFLYPPDRHARHKDSVARWLSLAPEGVTFAVDDWACNKVLDGWAELISHDGMKDSVFHGSTSKAKSWLQSKTWFAPMFHWGHNELLARHIGVERLVTADFTPMVESSLLGIDQDVDRVNAWVNASYHIDSHKWASANTTWPIVGFGCKALRQQRVLESDVTKMYQQFTGALVPAYECSGTGWWRPRLTLASYAGAVLGTSSKELCGICPHLPPASIETLSQLDIEMLALDQRTALRDCAGIEADIQRAINYLLKD